VNLINNLSKYWILYLIVFVAGGAIIAKVKAIIRYLILPKRNEEFLKKEREKRKMKDKETNEKIDNMRKSVCKKIDKIRDEVKDIKEVTDKNSGMLEAILNYTKQNGGL
jgi:hypothetical protein